MFRELNWGNKKFLIASDVPCFILSKLSDISKRFLGKKVTDDELGKP